VDEHDVTEWFAEYLDAFAACSRGERDTSTLLDYYGVPLLVTTDGGCFALTADDQVVGTLQLQVDAMHSEGFAASEVLDAEVELLNARSSLFRTTISRRRSDGSEISLLTAVYLITDGPDGRRFSVLAVRSS
jgi:hypothetical protein